MDSLLHTFENSTKHKSSRWWWGILIHIVYAFETVKHRIRCDGCRGVHDVAVVATCICLHNMWMYHIKSCRICWHVSTYATWLSHSCKHGMRCHPKHSVFLVVVAMCNNIATTATSREQLHNTWVSRVNRRDTTLCDIFTHYINTHTSRQQLHHAILECVWFRFPRHRIHTSVLAIVNPQMCKIVIVQVA